jgi:hypothetical protein
VAAGERDISVIVTRTEPTTVPVVDWANATLEDKESASAKPRTKRRGHRYLKAPCNITTPPLIENEWSNADETIAPFPVRTERILNRQDPAKCVLNKHTIVMGYVLTEETIVRTVDDKNH